MAKRLTKAERELLERRRIGGQLANAAFNLAQHEGPLTSAQRHALTLARLAWDQIERAKKVRAKS